MERILTQRCPDRARWQGRIVKGLIALGVMIVLFQSFMVVDASSFAGGGGASARATETFTDDADVIVTSTGIRKISSTMATLGSAAPGVEVTHDLPAVNNALTKNHYAYTFQVKEVAPSSWKVGDELTIEVYGDAASTPLLATLYIQQSKADDGYVEGVTATIDVGSSTSIPGRFDIIVTRQQKTPSR